MNFDELERPAIPLFTDNSLDSYTGPHKSKQLIQEKVRASSASSDSEWVSPFTVLPPLPALRKTRGEIDGLRSPEDRSHQRSTSSAYYAAAWGSPYATPSPNRSPPPTRSMLNSDDPGILSPLASRNLDPLKNSIVAADRPEQKRTVESGLVQPRRRATSWDRQKVLSERFNWFSESDHSGDERSFKPGKTPTKNTYLKRRRQDPTGSVEKLGSRGHHIQESVATITPDNFNAKLDSPVKDIDPGLPAVTMEPSTVDRTGSNMASASTDKPLPSLPPHSVNETKVEADTTAVPSSDSPPRPRITSIQSFQRPRRKVACKGKTCIIALPMVDRDEAGLPPLLSAREIKERVQKWVDEGYDVSGFTLASPHQLSSQTSGQSRALYPDPAEMYAERKNGKLHVHIPDQAEWDDWVDYLKEEKLRALGVTPSNSEAPLSTQSPFSSTLSRVSSQFPSLAASPPVGTLSANGNVVRIAGNTFSPQLNHPGAMSSHGGSHVASPLGGMTGPMHGYKQSIAYGNAHPRVSSPFDHPVPQPNPYGIGMRPMANNYGVRHFSPPGVANLQSLGQVLLPNLPPAPMIPSVPSIPSNDNGRGKGGNPTMEQIQQQQQKQQQIHAQMLQGQHQRQQSMFPHPPRSAELPRTPVMLESPTRSTPEIMHPTPRSHRHNLSAALQRGVDDAEAARSAQTSATLNVMLQQEYFRNKDNNPPEPEDLEQEELPVLKRPETLAEADDKSEIETNPSIAASPLLMDDQKNPFTNLSSLKDILKSQNDSQTYRHKPSASRFNVQAPEFNPSKPFLFTPPVAAKPVFVPSHQSKVSVASFQHSSQNPSLSNFNVAAPAFTPLSLKQDASLSSVHPTPAKDVTPSHKSTYTFGSPAFNVDAPEFKPGQSFSFKASDSTNGQSFNFEASSKVSVEAQQHHTSNGSIFGSVVVDPSSKASRRGTKVLSTTTPRSRSATPAEATDVDEEGRITAPTDRQKRARRGGSDGDQIPLFADSAPFDHANGFSTGRDGVDKQISSITDTVSEIETPTQGREAKEEQAQPNESVDHVSVLREDIPSEQKVQEPEPKVISSDNTTAIEVTKEIPELPRRLDSVTSMPSNQAVPGNPEQQKDTDKEDIVKDESGSEAPVTVKEDSLQEPAEVDPGSDGATENPTNSADAKPSKPGEAASPVTKGPELVQDASPKPSIMAPSADKSHGPKFSFSALAKPFSLQPEIGSTSREVEPTPSPVRASETQKPTGLAASRFADPDLVEKPAPGLNASRFAASPPPDTPDSIPQSPRYAATHAISPKPSETIDNSQSAEELYEHVQPKDVDRDLAEQALTHETSDLQNTTPGLPNINFEATPELTRSIEASMRADSAGERNGSLSDESKVDETMPSYEEIDAVMKQFEDNPDLGVERDDTPVKPTPLIDMRLPQNFRSDAPSPSPRRMQQGFPEFSPRHRTDYGLGIHRLNDSNGEVSDWGNDYSPRQEQKLQTRAGFFDEHVSELVDGLFENRLGPLERSLSTIQHSIALIATNSRGQARRSMSTDQRESDADDEDDYDAYEGFSHYRSRSPTKRGRRADTIKNAIADAMASYQPMSTEQPAFDMSEIHNALKEMRELAQQRQAPPPPQDVRAIIEDVISSQSQQKSVSIQEDYEALQEAARREIKALKSSLLAAEQRAHENARMQNRAEDEVQSLKGKLLVAQRDADQVHKAREEARISLQAFLEEKEAYRNLKVQLDAAEELNDEYRLSKKDWDQQLDTERTRNQDLLQALQMVRLQHKDQTESRLALRVQVEKLKERMKEATHDIASREVEWQQQVQELGVQKQRLEAALDHETRHREKAELELDDLDKEHKENMRFRVMHQQGEQEVVRLQKEVAQLREDCKVHQDSSFKFEREMNHAREVTEAQITKATAKMSAELEAAVSLRSDFEAQTSRLRSRLDNAEIDLEDQKAKHDADMAEVIDAHSQAIHEANEKHENALHEQHGSHEKKLAELRERHTRALHNSSDDRHRMEYQFNEKLSFTEDKVKHLEGKVADLEERLEISKSAARAAVEAATTKSINLPTPAPSVVASPPQRTASASMTLVKGTDIPEKISPQALRESIMVLQDQLQNREQRVEELEQELAAVDKDAPAKIKEREIEVTMLQELLSVRVDDLEDIISILSKPDFDRNATKDAAIRLKANLQMEQQLKERAAAANDASGVPSISSIANLTQSPRALPMAAAAAWGNWRKARDSGINVLTSMASNIGEQTPSKSRNGSPSNLMAGILTPPSTSQRASPVSGGLILSPPSMRPLAGAGGRKSNGPSGPAPRPLRSYSSQPQTLSSRQNGRRRESNESLSGGVGQHTDHAHPRPPSTPITLGKESPSLKGMDFSDDIDEDASSLHDSEHDQETVGIGEEESTVISQNEAVEA